MPLQATSGAASYDAFGGGVPVVPQYIEECFSTTLYTGNGSTQTITNGIDLSGSGGLVWIKSRSNAEFHRIFDTARGVNKSLSSNSTNAQNTAVNTVTAFNTTGFNLGNDSDGNGTNTNAYTYTSWTFRKQPKFFDVVTYTGNGTNGRTVAHSLGSTPGCIIVKRTDASNGWAVYHRAMNASPQDYMMRLNATDGAFTTTPSRWNNTLPTSTEFTLSGNDEVNGSGATYVAYLFAHDAGGFGLTGTDNVITCGSFTTNGSGNATVSLGYEPQWLMDKCSSGFGDWEMVDVMRGWVVGVNNDNGLRANSSDAESSGSNRGEPSSTGFNCVSFPTNRDFIYIAIRRGPMKVPTSGTTVFQAITDTGDTIETSTATFPLDMQFNTLYSISNATFNNQINDRLRGIGFAPSFTTTPHLTTASTAAETTTSTYLAFKGNGMDVSKDNGWGGTSAVFYNFRRAPSFFDEVCYTGTGSNITLNHNLGAIPELMIFKTRTGAARAWGVYSSAFGVNKKLLLNTTAAVANDSFFVDTTPTSTVFYPGNADESNEGGNTYVAYLFATCAGVQYINSYVGDGTTGRTINCGFTGGARFVCIKATSTSGSWWTFDSARGIVTNSDPALQLNSTAAEITSADAIDTASSGFIVNQEATCSLNANGVSYLVWAIA